MRLLGLAHALFLGLCAERVQARIYDPSTTPKAKYVAPLAAWPVPSYRAKDFAIVEWGGKFHLFYTRVQRHVPFHAGTPGNQILNEVSLGHAVSNDLETWTELDPILPVRTGQWDEHHVWAPTVAVHDGTAFLFYGGVRDSQTTPGSWIPRFQRIGVAMSFDPGLSLWFRNDAPVWQPCAGGGLPGVPWSVCWPYPMVGTADFRDPFVLEPDPASGQNTFQLYYTARVKTDQFNYVVGLAEAATPFAGFTDTGALWDTHYPPGNSKVESPHVFRHGGLLHLFFSGDDGINGIVWMTSLGSPLGPWTNRGTLRSMFGTEVKDEPYTFPLEVESWFASEHFRRSTPSGPVDYFAHAHAYDAAPAFNPPNGPPEDISTIEFRQMIWAADGTFSFATPNPVRSMVWSSPAALPGSTVKLRFTSEGVVGRNADLLISLVRNGMEFPIAPGSYELPATVALEDGLTEVSWVVPTFGRWLPLDFKVRLASQPLAHVATLRINTWGASSEGGSEVETAPPIVRTLNPTTAGAPLRELGLRRVPAAVAGAPGHTLALTLPADGHARLEMFDVRGRLVRVLIDESHPAGERLTTWDGRDDSGRAAPRGVYFVRLSTPFGERSVRLLHLGS